MVETLYLELGVEWERVVLALSFQPGSNVWIPLWPIRFHPKQRHVVRLPLAEGAWEPLVFPPEEG